MTTTSAPFTPEQVAALAWIQQGAVFVPYLCPRREAEDGAIGHGAHNRPELTATPNGLVCPVCGYVREEVPAAVLAWAVCRTVGGEKGKRR